jgi:hypothetical protein
VTYARHVHGYTTPHLPHHEDAGAKRNPFRPRGYHGLYNYDRATVELSNDSAIKVVSTVMVAQAAKINQTTLQVPEQKRTSTALDPSPAIKKVCLDLPNASNEVVIAANLNPK